MTEAARWRLAAPHYLNVPGSEWEYKEVDRTSGKQKRTMFPVPMLLDPDQPTDWNHVHAKDQGEIIVTDGKGEVNVKDIVFVGPPTPDMVPMNPAAEAVTAKHAHLWKHPIESLSTTYADEMLKTMKAEVEQVRAQAPSEGITEVLAAMATMMKQNQELISMLANNAKPAAAPAATARRT